MRRLWLAVLLVACSKGKAVGDAASSTPEVADEAPKAMDAREAAQWAASKDGDPEELMRLADLTGCEGLRERATQQPDLRPTALSAMQYCTDFSELPYLAQVGTEGNDSDARAALASAVALSARPRRSVDPEDADDLHAGCASLLELARSTRKPKERRVAAIRALRMLSEYGCVKRADVPTDLDVH